MDLMALELEPTTLGLTARNRFFDCKDRLGKVKIGNRLFRVRASTGGPDRSRWNTLSCGFVFVEQVAFATSQGLCHVAGTPRITTKQTFSLASVSRHT